MIINVKTTWILGNKCYKKYLICFQSTGDYALRWWITGDELVGAPSRTKLDKKKDELPKLI